MNSPRTPVLVLALLVALFLLPTFSFHAEGLRFGSDIVQQFFPSKSFLRESLRSGQLPLWNPHTFSGAPFLANPQRAAIFYPDLLLWLTLPLKIGIWLTQAAHLFLAALGMYLLVRHYTENRPASLFAAVAFAFGGYFTCRLFAGHLPQMQASVWLPWIIFSYEKVLERDRPTVRALVTALLLALCLLAGFPEIAFMSGVALGLRFVWELARALRSGNAPRALLINFASVLAVTLGLTAVQLLPTLELLAVSDRVHTSYDVVRQRSLPPINLATFLIPDLLGSGALRNTVQGSLSIESAAYVGVAPLLLALVAPFLRRDRRVFFYVALAVLAVFLALGGNNPLYPLVRALPGFRQVAAPYRFVFLWTFAVSVLAGLGAHALLQPTADPRRLRRFAVLVLVMAAAATVITVAYIAFRPQILALAERAIRARYPDEAALRLSKLGGFYATQRTGLALWAAFSALTGLLLLVRVRGARAWLPHALVALLVLDLWALNGKYLLSHEGIRTMESERRLGHEAFLAGDREPYRVLPLPEANLFPDAVLLHGISSIAGYDPIVLSSYKRYLETLEGGPPGELDPRAPHIRNYKSPLVDRLNVKYIVSAEPISDPGLSLAHDAGAVRVYRKRSYIPRATLVHEVERVESDEAALALLPGLPPDAPVALLLPDAPTLALRSPQTPEPLPRVELRGPNRRVIQADLAAPGLLVLSEVYLPGWRARVDGRPATILRANYLFCGIALPEGRHTVDLVYAPASVWAGAAVTGVTLAGIALVGLLRRRRWLSGRM